ncbi:MAG: hypothetical protein JJ896_04070 [Rhodothermales bacterium]|nr:hypothetical protein [Rhodothermales bacterium]MBO6778812.1 hypothetical protein [Rhodothermales bacterium]
MVHAIREFGHSVEVYWPGEITLSLLRAYLDYGIPAVLTFRIVRTGGTSVDLADYDGETLEQVVANSGGADSEAEHTVTNGPPHRSFSQEPLHAVTFCGYRTVGKAEGESPMSPQERSLGLGGGKVARLFGHDDQVGPYARHIPLKGGAAAPLHLTGTWTAEDHQCGVRLPGQQKSYLPLIPHLLLVPMYSKIRVRYTAIESWTVMIDQAVRASLFLEDENDTSWEIELTDSSNYKREVARSSHLDEKVRANLLEENLPRFLWVARLSVKKARSAELIYDATDIDEHDSLEHVLWEREEVRGILSQQINSGLDVGLPKAVVDKLLGNADSFSG